jgi:hypothetical protein
MKMNGFRIKAFLTGALLCAVLSACGSISGPGLRPFSTPANGPDASQSVSPAGPDELDAAIREASTYLNGRVPESSKAVFLNISSDYPDLSEYLLNVLSENAVNDGVFSVVDRQQLDVIRAELNFQMSEEVSVESAQSIGQMLGAQTIVSGAVSKIGSLYRVQVKAIEVQSAGVQGQWSRNVPAGPTIAALTERYAPTATAVVSIPSTRTPAASAPAAGVTPAQTPAQPAPAPEPEVPAIIYKIGDEGPGGGFVFYDKGVVTNGWRYLEAAPNDIGPAQWGAIGTEVNGTNTAVGTGRANTQRIVPVLEQVGEDGAALLCASLNINGYTGWFLPSNDELNLMYVNLKAKGLGGFGNGWYWSSSQTPDSWTSSSARQARTQNFSNGSQNATSEKNNTYSVRACRQF